MIEIVIFGKLSLNLRCPDEVVHFVTLSKRLHRISNSFRGMSKRLERIGENSLV